MALAFNLAAIPAKFMAIPVLAGLAAGTGAIAAYVTSPTPAMSASAETKIAALPAQPAATTPAVPATVIEQAAVPAKPEAKPSCEQQTWPYLDNRCIARGNDAKRNIRMVMAPRAGEASPPASATANLVTSDTVLRGPNVAPEVNEQPSVKKPAKRSEQRRQRSPELITREAANRDGFKRVYSVYSVPSAESANKPVIVVRPLPLNTYSSRF
jgi:hypothetical protein